MSSDIVARLRESDGGYFVRQMFNDAADEIERLHRDYSCICGQMRRMMDERDAARREVCNLLWQKWNGSETEIAAQRGWDCFKEETDGK